MANTCKTCEGHGSLTYDAGGGPQPFSCEHCAGTGVSTGKDRLPRYGTAAENIDRGPLGPQFEWSK